MHPNKHTAIVFLNNVLNYVWQIFTTMQKRFLKNQNV